MGDHLPVRQSSTLPIYERTIRKLANRMFCHLAQLRRFLEHQQKEQREEQSVRSLLDEAVKSYSAALSIEEELGGGDLSPVEHRSDERTQDKDQYHHLSRVSRGRFLVRLWMSTSDNCEEMAPDACDKSLKEAEDAIRGRLRTFGHSLSSDSMQKLDLGAQGQGIRSRGSTTLEGAL